MTNFAFGMIATGYLVAGLFFAKFWSRTGDPLFVAFAVAFWLLALNQTLVVLLGAPREDQSWIYLLRLAAFTLISIAIIHKNTRARASRD